MIAIELYRKYLINSSQGLIGEQRNKKLSFEKDKLTNILMGLDILFSQDTTITDKKDHTIYTVIKRDIISDAAKGNPESVIFTTRFLLEGIINEIEKMQEKSAA